MATYLYTWNPQRWNWGDLKDAILKIDAGETYEIPWSCGNTKKIRTGDNFILMRLGVDPKGVIGIGKVSSELYPKEHWDKEKAAAGQNALRTDLLFQTLSEVPFISIDRLQKEFNEFNWTPQASGTTVPDEISEKIFSEISESTSLLSVDEKTLQLYAEGKLKEITSKTYERNPRARHACIEHYGFSCAVCGFNFGKAFGNIGEGYVEVHHLRQIADVGEEYLVDPITDLRPVCSNCHKMLHRRRPPYGIEEIKNIIRPTSK